MNKILIVLLGLVIIQCKAQNVINIQNWNGQYSINTYIMDVNNVFNTFEGTWLYTNGNTTLKIVLVKRVITLANNYSEDLLVGEYQYIENGVEKFNSLVNLNAFLPSEYHHKIHGNFIPTTPTPFDNYTSGETRVQLIFSDNIGGNINIRKTIISGQEAIQIFKISRQETTVKGQLILQPILPDGFYTLIKQ